MTARPDDVAAQVRSQRQRVSDRLAAVRRVVAVMSGKGGVGKSALTANLAAAFALRGWAVGVLDADLNGASAAAMLGARGQAVRLGADGAQPAVGVAGVRVMSMDLFLDGDDRPVAWKHPGGLAADGFAWRGLLEANVLREYLSDTDWGALDLLLIDLPPGAGGVETLARFVPGRVGAVVVTIPSPVAYLVVRRSVQAARQAGVSLLGLVENMASPADEAGGAQFAAEARLAYLGSVPHDPSLARATDSGRPPTLHGAVTPAGAAILAVMERLEAVLAGADGTNP